jgi:hypothetical protein
MGDDGGYTNVGISKGVAFEILIVDGVDGRKDSLFKFLCVMVAYVLILSIA